MELLGLMVNDPNTVRKVIIVPGTQYAMSEVVDFQLTQSPAQYTIPKYFSNNH